MRTKAVACGVLGASVLALSLAAMARLAAPAKPSYTVLSSDLQELRARFNADADQVRVLMLLSPS